MMIHKCYICGSEYDPMTEGWSHIVPFEWQEKRPGEMILSEMGICDACGEKLDNYISKLREEAGDAAD